jgi:hypothetical protein
VPHPRPSGAAGAGRPVAPPADRSGATGQPSSAGGAGSTSAIGPARSGAGSTTANPATTGPNGSASGTVAGTEAQPAAERGGLTALAAALRSMTSARPIVTVPGKAAPSRPPAGRPLVLLCLWAALLALVGLGIGIRGLVVIIANHPASWFKPTLIISGVAGILLTACGFVTARRPMVPWAFLAAATAVLIASVVFSAAV